MHHCFPLAAEQLELTGVVLFLCPRRTRFMLSSCSLEWETPFTQHTARCKILNTYQHYRTHHFVRLTKGEEKYLCERCMELYPLMMQMWLEGATNCNAYDGNSWLEVGSINSIINNLTRCSLCFLLSNMFGITSMHRFVFGENTVRLKKAFFVRYRFSKL